MAMHGHAWPFMAVHGHPWGDRPRTEHEPVHDWFMNRFAGYGSVFTPGSGSHGSPVFTVRPVLARTGSRFALSVRFAAFMSTLFPVIASNVWAKTQG